LAPEHERIDRCDRQRERYASERACTIAVSPREECKRRQQGDADDAREDGEPGYDSRRSESPTLGEGECRERKQEEERLVVDGLQEERHRKDGEVEDRPPCTVGAEPLFREPVQQEERSECGRERDDDAGEQVVREERVPDEP